MPNSRYGITPVQPDPTDIRRWKISDASYIKDTMRILINDDRVEAVLIDQSRSSIGEFVFDSSLDLSFLLDPNIQASIFVDYDISEDPGTGIKSNTLSGIGLNSTTTAHQTFVLTNNTQLLITDNLSEVILSITDSNKRVGILTGSPSSPLTVAGIIESTTGGIKFPDGTIQTTSSGTHTHVSADITNFNDSVDSQTTAFLVAGTNITLTPGSGILTIDAASSGGTITGLTDVTISAIGANEILQWTGSAWINRTLAEAGIQTTGHSHVINDLTDVVITSIANNEVLTYDTGTSKWINETLAEAGISATGHTHTVANITDLTATAAELNLLDLAALSAGWVLRASGASTAAWAQLGSSDLNNNANFIATGDTPTLAGLNITGESLTLNSDAVGSGTDWTYLIDRPTTGMTASITLTLPPIAGTAGQVLQTTGSGNTSFVSVPVPIEDEIRRYALLNGAF